MYDVSNFADEHPGGSVISTYFGRDGTDVFSSFHAASTWKILQDFYIGDVEASHDPHASVISLFAIFRIVLIFKNWFTAPVDFLYQLAFPTQ